MLFRSDEAQQVKNAGAQSAQAARELDAVFRLALTGTPVENRLSDLWSIYDLVMPGLLGGPTRFSRAFLEPPEQDGHLVPEDADLLAQRLVVRDELGGVARGAGCAAVSRALIGGVGLGGPGVDGVHLLSTRRT